MAYKILDTSYDDPDINTNSSAIDEKLPVLIETRTKELDNFHDIPVDKLIEFQAKGDRDFSEWSEERFEELVQSVSEYGILEPITIRTIEGSNQFEILAGEHRWKASKALGLPTIPARLLQECSDEDAVAIFTLTNIMRRDTNLKDRAYGCWLYVSKTKFKRAEAIQEMITSGELSSSDKEQLSKKQISRYAKLHTLPPELFDLVDQKIISIESGVKLASLEGHQQEDIIECKKLIKSNQSVGQIMQLDKGEINDYEWSEESIKEILTPVREAKEYDKKTFAYVKHQASTILKKRLGKDMYEYSEEILNEALDLYYEKHKKSTSD